MSKYLELLGAKTIEKNNKAYEFSNILAIFELSSYSS